MGLRGQHKYFNSHSAGTVIIRLYKYGPRAEKVKHQILSLFQSRH